MKRIICILSLIIALYCVHSYGQWNNSEKADDTAYGVSWDGSKKAATQNALYDIISALGGGHDAITLDANAQNLLTLTDQALGIHTQVANRVYAGPITGADAVPTFRALVAEDIPTLNQNTTGTAAGLTAQYIDWNAVSGGASIANKPTLGTMAAATATDYVAKALYDANTILYATSDNTPAALTVAEQRVVGRATGGDIAALTLGNAAGNVAQWPADPAAHTLFGFDNTGNIYRPITIGATLAYDQASNTISVATAPALSSDPSDCTGGQFATGIAANGNLTCATPSGATLTDLDDLPGDTTDNDKIDQAIVEGMGQQATAGYITLYEASGNGTNFWKWLMPDALTNSLTFAYPNADPTVGQVMSWGAPSSNVSTGAWVSPLLSTATDNVKDTHIDWGSGAGQVNIVDVPATAWRLFYSNGSGVITELALGDSGLVLKSNGASAAPTWETDSTGAGGDQLVDIVTTAPLRVNGGANVDNALPGSDADITFSVSAASDSAAGVIELATTAETNTGTATDRAVTPDGLSGSVYGQKEIGWTVYDSDVSTAVADGKQAAVIPASMNGMNLVDVTCSTSDVTGATSGATTVVLRRVRGATAVDMTSTGVTIDYNAYTASDETVDTSNDDVATGDKIFVDVNGVSSGAAAKGLYCTAVFQLP